MSEFKKEFKDYCESIDGTVEEVEFPGSDSATLTCVIHDKNMAVTEDGDVVPAKGR